MKFTAAAIALASAITVDAAVLGERATYAVKGKPEGMLNTSIYYTQIFLFSL